jgi:hypothetical protein
VTGIGADGVAIILRDEQHLLRNAVSNGDLESGYQNDLMSRWLGADSGKFYQFLRHNNSYAMAGHIAAQLQGVEPLSASQAAALTRGFLDRNVSIAPSSESWSKMLDAGGSVLSPTQLEVVRQCAIAATGEEVDLPSP